MQAESKDNTYVIQKKNVSKEITKVIKSEHTYDNVYLNVSIDNL